ncbi:MAG: ABC transporter substrate-binding protein [Chloroflexi bacterium]|nr:ABC transporter substrate-binding protein [Chloroflexota bacterium]
MKKLYSVMGIGMMLALLLGACAPQVVEVEVPGEVVTVPEVVTVVVPGEAPPVSEEVEPVTILASWGGDEEAGFREVLDAFTAKTGIPFRYEGSRAVTVLLASRVAGGSPPDVAMLPRPGVMVALAREGSILPLDGVRGDEILPPDILTDNYSQAWIDLGTVDNLFYGLTVKANSKSTFWYKPPSFEALGVSPPNTFDELTAIADDYLANGQTPYSMGGLDGWTLTDWFENIYVRIAGPEMYLKLFVTHEVEWTDPTVVEAMERFREIVDPDTKLAGGSEGALSTGFIDAFSLVLRDDPVAEMYYEGGFMSSFGEQNHPDLVCGEDYAFFEFPEIDPAWGKPVVGGGDLAVVFVDRPEVREFIRFLASEEANTIWASAEAGSVISPNSNVSLDVYSPCKALEAAQLTQAASFVFDGSDLAPAALGGDAMFVGLQDFVDNPAGIAGVLEFLEEVADRVY